MSKVGYAAIALLIAVLIGGYVWWQQRAEPEPQPVAVVSPPSEPASPVAAAPAEPVIQHPITAPVDETPAPPAAPATVEERVTNALVDVVGRKAVLSMLQSDDFVRRVVVTVDNLPRAHAAPRLWPVNPSEGRFTVRQAEGTEVIDPDNGLRYTPFLLLVESVDLDRAVAHYRKLYPQFQQAYEELGYPGRYFNDRLVEVIDHLLAAPEPERPPAVKLTEVKGPMKSERPWVRYEYADPQYEALSAGQKMMLRVGPVNERRLKARLSELRQHIAREAPAVNPASR